MLDARWNKKLQPSDFPRTFMKWLLHIQQTSKQKETTTVVYRMKLPTDIIQHPQSHNPTTNCHSLNCTFCMWGCCFCLVRTNERLQLAHRLHKKKLRTYKMSFGILSRTIFWFVHQEKSFYRLQLVHWLHIKNTQDFTERVSGLFPQQFWGFLPREIAL